MAQKSPPPSASFGFAIPQPSEEDLKPLVVPAPSPASGDSNQPTKPTLLILFPGGLLYPKDYHPLLEALQQAHSNTSSDLSLWISVAAINWSDPKVQTEVRNTGDAAAHAALEAAISAGFPAQTTRMGRADNVFVAAHSISTIFIPGYPMRHAGGVILLGSGLLGQDDFWPEVASFPRPILHVFGGLDGQQTLPKAAVIAADAGRSVRILGVEGAARTRPVVLVPGMNHAQFSNGVVNLARGDLPSISPTPTTLTTTATSILNFITANHPESISDSPFVVHCVKELVKETRAAGEILGPYVEALGRVSSKQLFDSASANNCRGGNKGIDHVEMLQGCFGSEAMSVFYPGRKYIAHPGEKAAAEAFCVEAQKKMLKKVMKEGDVEERVKIVVTVHTSLDSFTYNQPLIYPNGPGKCIVHAQCYMEREALINYNPTAPQSPVYFLKLKKGGLVKLALGLINEVEDAHITASEINAETWAAAQTQAAPAVREIFGSQGTQLTFDDKDITSIIKTPVDWMTTKLDFTYSNTNTNSNANTTKNCTLISPYVSTEVAVLPRYDAGPARFAGAHYIKCPSLAWMHEWLMVMGLRPPPPPPPLPSAAT